MSWLYSMTRAGRRCGRRTLSVSASVILPFTAPDTRRLSPGTSLHSMVAARALPADRVLAAFWAKPGRGASPTLARA